ncbi:PREDICTED: uncharacterized protein LOC109157045 [Ipomoea nil]|uniref:uncharacterized protein LOC109157045 n=1 Tax=Ipomoea nil TaxID=35883 RepID=UPI000900FCF4|nr:PREDICTED: uncharacterized protein LOC109157045 [Ipomoea nil]
MVLYTAENWDNSEQTGSLNCRGLGNSRTVREVVGLVSRKKPDFVFLMETKVDRTHAECLHVKLGFDGLFYVDRVGLSGALALLWIKNNTARLMSFSRNHIDVEVSMDSFANWRMTCYYGYPERTRRTESWELLKSLAPRSGLHWIMVGDFNDLMFQYEKSGGNPHPDNLLRGFWEVIEQCGLTQMPMCGYQFTWEKGKGTAGWIEKRLDKVLATDELCGIVIGARVFNLLTRTSYHFAIFLAIQDFVVRGRVGRRRFRFDMTWLYDEGCRGVVAKSWDEGRNEGTPSCIIHCGNRLAQWGGDRYHKFGEKLINLRREQLHLRGRTDPTSLAEFQRLEETLTRMEAQEDVYWRQRAKQHWLKDADVNTKFYHRSLPTFLGYSVGRGDISSFIVNCLNLRSFPSGLNDTDVVLILKKNNPELVLDLRPIALSNVIYRVMAKMITQRMKPMIENIISESQSAFIPGRLITGNILIAEEVGHYLNRKQCGAVGWSALKLDMAKAYDRMEWPFLRGRNKKAAFAYIEDKIRQRIGSWNKKFVIGGAQELIMVFTGRARYYPKDSFSEAFLGNNPSYCWRSIMAAKDLICSGVRRRIGNGNSTLIWGHPWL